MFEDKVEKDKLQGSTEYLALLIIILLDAG